MVITILPEEHRKMTCKEKMDYIIEMTGHNPFERRSRLREQVVWRYCIYYKLSLDGYIASDIARATGYDHSTVLFGLKSIKRDLEFRNEDAVETWRELLDKVQGSIYI